jgi:hypothetical protein
MVCEGKSVPETPLQDKRTVLQILESFKGTGPLRELLANLNYDPLNEAVSRNDWPAGAKAALAQDPRLYGRAAGEFYVIYAQLAADKLKLTDERAVIPQLLKQYPYALFVFSDKSQTNFHFVNVKWENTQKRRLYRRITVGPQERLRTAVERISMLDTQTIPAGLFGVKAQEIQDQHDEAFDVAKVTKDFYEEYKRVFEIMRDAIKGFGASDDESERRHLFTQRLFNRLMFLRFIQKKGWLTIDGRTTNLPYGLPCNWRTRATASGAILQSFWAARCSGTISKRRSKPAPPRCYTFSPGHRMPRTARSRNCTSRRS